jgi:hypothetical protein
VTDSALSDAKQTLLRALEHIEEIEREMDGTVWALCVVYSITNVNEETGDVHESSGWNATSEPAWATAAMLRLAADHIEASPADDEE